MIDAIRLQPDDMSLRLVYADWLLDHGEDVRASLVRDPESLFELRRINFGDARRWQVRSSSTVNKSHIAESMKIANEVGGLGWLGEQHVSIVVVVRGGFIDCVSGGIGMLMASGREICRDHPVKRLFVCNRRPYCIVSGLNARFAFRCGELVDHYKSNTVPCEIFDMLRSTVPHDREHEQRVYRFMEEAADDLNQCVLRRSQSDS